MKISELEIPDVKYESIDKSKIDLANKIVLSLIPLLQPRIVKRIKEVKNLKESVRSKKEEILREKTSLQELQISYQKKKKINLLLGRVEQLINVGIDESLKSEMITMIRKVNELPEEKIDFYLTETLRIITRRFSKIERE